MITRSCRIRPYVLAALITGLLAVSKADAHGGHGGHSTGHAARAPHFSGGQRAYKAPRMSQSAGSLANKQRGDTTARQQYPGSLQSHEQPGPRQLQEHPRTG